MKRALAAALLVLAVAACSSSGDDSEAAQAAEPDREDEAVDVCRQSVEGKLKAPATAEFSDITADALTNREDRFDVAGHVDAENGFGALIRITWTCDAQRRSDGSWSVETNLTD